MVMDETLYAHMPKYIVKGREIKKIIGYVGNTGTSVAHLHYDA